jgi:multiple sugar transport system permease protein
VRASPAARALRAIAIAAIIAWSLGPILIGIVTSISSQADAVAVPARWIPNDPNVDSYSALLGGEPGQVFTGGAASDASAFGQSLLSSAVVTVEATLAILAVSIAAGYGFSRLPFRGSRVLFWIVLGTLTLPLFTLVVALFRLMADLGLLDTQLGLVLVYVSALAPLAIWLFHNHCRDLPVEPEEAALIDGCTHWQAFRKVVLPQMRSGIAAVSAIIMLSVYVQFLIPLLLASTQNTKPVTVVIAEFVGKYSTNYPLLTAAGVLAIIPPAIVALALNRHIRGMLSGSTG